MHSCPVLFAVSCLLISGGENESSSLSRDLGDVKELPWKDVRSNTRD